MVARMTGQNVVIERIDLDAIEVGNRMRRLDRGRVDALTFVLSANLHRRHLDESQRATVAARIANLQDGQHVTQGPPYGEASNVVPITQKAATKTTNLPDNQQVTQAAPIGAANVVPITQEVASTLKERGWL